MTTTDRPTARIRINRTRTSTGKHGYDATVEVAMPIGFDNPGTINLEWLREEALRESDILIAELEQRVNGAEVQAPDAR